MSNVPANLKYAASHEWMLLNADGTITVGYPVVTNAASYEHYMKKDGAAAVLVGTTPTLTYTHTGLTSGSYEALVRAIP